MVELLIGKKGTGKTKALIEKVNNALTVAKGNVVFQLLPTSGAQQVNMGIWNAGHGLQHHAVIFVFCHFRNG